MKRTYYFKLLGLFGVIVLMTSCGLYRNRIQPEKDTQEIKRLLEHIEKQNRSILSLKGIGKVSSRGLSNNNMNERVAFLAQQPDRLRIEILGPFGPLIRFSTDGEWVYFTHQMMKKVYKKKASASIFRRYLPIPLIPSDVIDLLSGRIPIQAHQYVEVERQPNEKVLSLYKTFGLCQKIYIQKNDQVRAFEVFNTFGRLEYGVELKDYKRIQNYWIPNQIIVNDSSKGKCTLLIQSYEPNNSIDLEQFSIQK